jgi:hypothetical protein
MATSRPCSCGCGKPRAEVTDEHCPSGHPRTGKPGAYRRTRTGHGRTRQEWVCRKCISARVVARLPGQRADRQAGTAPHATSSGEEWTLAELETALRDDLTISQAALELGRTYQAVRMRRYRARKEPL